jgi:uncharacterized protein (DUF302 family)
MNERKRYAFGTLLEISYDDAIAKVRGVLKEEGFGIVTEIEVKKTAEEKLDQECKRYVILGACTPPYAYQALEATLDAGLLLPCNVIVYETGDKKAYVAASIPVSALEIIKSPNLEKIALKVAEKMQRAVMQVVQDRGAASSLC